MDMSLMFVGTGASTPSARRGLPALLLRRGGEHLLFDCGEGTQRQLARAGGLADLDKIFVTHFHADHWLGLPGMLKSFALRERERPLTVYGPPGLRQLMSDVRFVYGRLPYELSVVELEPMQSVGGDGYAIGGVPVRHRVNVAYGYVLVEDPRPGHLDAKLAERLGVTPGPDFGRLQRGETVAGVRPEQVMGPQREGRKIAISGDTAPCEAMQLAAHRADLLVHEATFADEELQRAQETLHSTARQAAEVARAAEVRLLALTHISTRYAGGELRAQAREVFPATEAPRDFDTIELPFPERGVPRLVRWRPESASRATGEARAEVAAGEPHAQLAPAGEVDAEGAAAGEVDAEGTAAGEARAEEATAGEADAREGAPKDPADAPASRDRVGAGRVGS
jgi:ribonuclease Z